MKNYLVEDIFTPASPARINFVERVGINNRIVRALKTKGRQVIIYGHSGSGKTTLIENKLQQVYENHIKTNCMKGMSFESVLLDAFDQLGEYYIDEETSSSKSTIDAGIKAKFVLISTQLSAKKEKFKQSKSKRILPPQLTGPNLAKMIGEAKCCWVLEDFHKIVGDDKRKLSQLMKVFMDLSDIYPNLKIIALGAVNTARQVVQYDGEMRRRISEIHVPLMSDVEIGKIVRNGCKFLNLKIDDDLIDDISHHSNGVASICHQICQLMCEAHDVFCTYPEDDLIEFEYANLTYALSEYLELESDTIKYAFDCALQLHDSSDVIYALSGLNQSGGKIEEIFKILEEKEYRYEEQKILEILEKLVSEKHGELVKYDYDSHKYSFSDPFYRTFSLAYFRERDIGSIGKRLNKNELLAIIDSAFRNMKGDFSVNQGLGVQNTIGKAERDERDEIAEGKERDEIDERDERDEREKREKREKLEEEEDI